jgi:hypothetical protein
MNLRINDKGFSEWFSQNIKGRIPEIVQEQLGGRCYICGKECTSYCNSHSIPQFVLKNLSKIGEYSTFASVSGKKYLKPTIGKNNAGTFHLICADCDRDFFKEYENEEVYSDLKKPLPHLFLEKIHIKNLLYLMDKELCNLKDYSAALNHLQTEIPESLNQLKIQIHCSAKRIEKYGELFDCVLHYSKRNIPTQKLLYLRELPYNVPVAIQLAIPVGKGLSGETINDFKKINKPFHMLNICVFPMANKSVIILSCHIAGKEYDTFAVDFNSLALDKQLEIINFMIFQYSEDFFGNPEVFEKVSQDPKLLEVCQRETECDLTIGNIPKIPNLLSAKFAI